MCVCERERERQRERGEGPSVDKKSVTIKGRGPRNRGVLHILTVPVSRSVLFLLWTKNPTGFSPFFEKRYIFLPYFLILLNPPSETASRTNVYVYHTDTLSQTLFACSRQKILLCRGCALIQKPLARLCVSR